MNSPPKIITVIKCVELLRTVGNAQTTLIGDYNFNSRAAVYQNRGIAALAIDFSIIDPTNKNVFCAPHIGLRGII